jgi:N-acetylmuramoyl-L-alanine amidase
MTTVLREVRFWSSADVTRIAIETSKEVDFKHGQLQNPSRLFVDLVDARTTAEFKGLAYTIPVNDGLVKKIRVAPNQASTTRVVLDLEAAAVVSASRLVNPPRIVLDVRRATGDPVPPILQPGAAPAVSHAPALPPPSLPPPLPQAKPESVKAAAPPPPPAAVKPEPVVSAKVEVPKLVVIPAPTLPPPSAMPVTPSAPTPTPPPGRSAEAARMVTPSLTRALGLKLNRVALDAGHGGFDPGSDGPTGLVEKELALDVTLRVGKLLEQRTDIEVIYTRKDDTFIDLHERAPLANRAKADLFLSIHANTAPVRSVVGAETYYLNRGESKADLALATRENALASKSISELGDLVKKIVAYDKRDESRELAARVQAATHELSVQTYGRVYNRGVRHSPLVVLIGATMPAVLVEVGFISSIKEEALLKKAEHRQKVAEAIYKGIVSYARSLSHYSMASAED